MLWIHYIYYSLSSFLNKDLLYWMNIQTVDLSCKIQLQWSKGTLGAPAAGQCDEDVIKAPDNWLALSTTVMRCDLNIVYLLTVTEMKCICSFVFCSSADVSCCRWSSWQRISCSYRWIWTELGISKRFASQSDQSFCSHYADSYN